MVDLGNSRSVLVFINVYSYFIFLKENELLSSLKISPNIFKVRKITELFEQSRG